VPPVLFGRAGRPSHFQEWKLFNSHSIARSHGSDVTIAGFVGKPHYRTLLSGNMVFPDQEFQR
ncbi:hypothetical protein, partial [Microcoleus sp. D3_18a_C4]|uniref:hypothetical protein n=1 Tax=Microcoleus sp. D3_18a_C4 TaxID=3055332 RepID=UPI002FD1E6C7